MSCLWTFDNFDQLEPERAAHLRSAPSWLSIVDSVREALKISLDCGNTRFGLEMSSRNREDSRGVIQFSLGKPLFDWFFNSTTGYRAQFRRGSGLGLSMNDYLVAQLVKELNELENKNIQVHKYVGEFSYIDTNISTISEFTQSFVPKFSKLWVCEKLIGTNGITKDLFVSRTGPKLLLKDTDAWQSLFPEESDGWIELKGAFISPEGLPYQFKSFQMRAENLEERGTA